MCHMQYEGGGTLVMQRLEVREGTFEFAFDVRNDSEEDAWLCESSEVSRSSQFEVFLDEDGQTLVIRRRLDVATNRTSYARVEGRYVCLGAGEARREVVSLSLPVGPDVVFADVPAGAGRQELARVVLEIGYYTEDLPGLAESILSEAARYEASGDTLDGDILSQYFGGFVVATEFGGLAGFEASNSDSDLSEEVVIPYTYQALKGERCARIVVDGVAVPYEYGGPAY